MELRMDKDVQLTPGKPAVCGVLWCTESISSIKPASSKSSDHTGDASGIITSMEIFKTDRNQACVEGSDIEKKTLMASVSTHNASVSRDTPAGGKIDGLLAAGQASILLELASQEDCRSNFVCEVRAVDGKGKEVASSSKYEQSETGHNKGGDGSHESALTSVMMQLINLVQQMDKKLALFQNSIEDKIEDKLASIGSRIEFLEQKMDSTKHFILGEINDISCNHMAEAINDTLISNTNFYQNINGYLTLMGEELQMNLKELQSNISTTTAVNFSSYCDTIANVTTPNQNSSISIVHLSSLKQCYKGMSPVPPQDPYPYTLIADAEEIGKSVLCDTQTNKGGWIIIQRRPTMNVSFNRSWEDYKLGFGSLRGDFWLGNQYIHEITKSGTYQLWVDLKYSGQTKFAKYAKFSVAGEDDRYRLRLGRYSAGTAGDSFAYHDGVQFSTPDHMLTNSFHKCAEINHGGWWFSPDGSCDDVYLNGLWRNSNMDTKIEWSSVSEFSAMEYTEMKIRRV